MAAVPQPHARTHLRAEGEVEALGAREDVGGLDEVGDADGSRRGEHGRSLLCRVGDLEDVEARLLGVEAVQQVRVDFAAQGGAGRAVLVRPLRYLGRGRRPLGIAAAPRASPRPYLSLRSEPRLVARRSTPSFSRW